jgi:hypothetical protein
MPRRGVATVPPPTAKPPASPEPLANAPTTTRPAIVVVHPAARRHRLRLGKLALMVLGVAAAIAFRQLERPPAASYPLPSTPQEWVHQFAAAVLQDPHDVCARLFSPQLASAYAAGRRTNCTKFLTHATDTPFGIRRILRAGATAVVELRQAITGGYWDVVLSRDGNGWRALDLVGGTTLK